MKKLKGAIIGCGAIAREHLAAVAQLKDVEIAAVCDISAARAEAAAERFDVPMFYTNYEELILEVSPDLVHITTPPSSHFPIAKTCLHAGLNVLCEKPITTDYQSFQVLRELALDKNCLLMENQNFRYHSGVCRIFELVRAGELGDILDAQICIGLNIFGSDSSYVDLNAAHPASVLRGGVIGDFLPHIAYLAYMCTGTVIDVRTIWRKYRSESPLQMDEFRGIIKGPRATAYVSFSGNSKPDGFWVRVTGTQAQVETNLFEPPRLIVRRLRHGEPALTKLFDGIIEARDVFKGSVGSLWRKLGGISSYDGLAQLVGRTYEALASGSPPPVSLDDVAISAWLVDRFTSERLQL
jgi:predicted dehydrogenase